jgi:hypothetical protein
MDTKEIKNCLEQYEFLGKTSLGVFPADMLPTQFKQLPASFIANTDDSRNPGQHWVAFYVANDGKLEYFDSYGFKPVNKLLQNYINKNLKKHTFNKKRLQGEMSTTCGQYCLSYLFYRNLDISMCDYAGKFNANDFHENDHKVQDIVEYYFDFSSPLFQNENLNQICKALGH